MSVLHRRNIRAGDRAKAPELFPRFNIHHGWQHAHFAFPRIGRSHRDPLLEVGNNGIRQLAIGRHLERIVAQRAQQQALVDIVRHDGRAGFAAAPDARSCIEQQAPTNILRIGRVASITMLNENRPNLGLEECELLRWYFGGRKLAEWEQRG